MLKKLLAFAATALLSLNASAGYTRYDFSDPQSAVSGYFIQSDTDQSIADYQIHVNDLVNNVGAGAQPYPYHGFVQDAYVYNHLPGPTNFVVDDDNSDIFAVELSLRFFPSENGNFDVLARLSRSPMFGLSYLGTFAHTYITTVTPGVVSQGEQVYLDQASQYLLPRVLPRQVNLPEPGSLALFAAGAFAALGMARRRKPLP